VYAAEEFAPWADVAIKFLSASSDSHHFRARFLREARSISLLSHPNIATLFDYGETNEEQHIHCNGIVCAQVSMFAGQKRN